MCGIWGFASDLRTVPLSNAWNGLCSLRERGPDDWGVYAKGRGILTSESELTGDSSVVIGNRRLSILDLSAAGRQPMVADGRYRIVYNGELYNYRELRNELETTGHSFESDTDTEVVLRAYTEWGESAVQRFRGMFAFGIWDEEEREVFLARDRLGIKPLYYSHENGRLAFASTVTALLDSNVVDRQLDPAGVDGFLTFGSVPAPRTIVDGVRPMPPGTTLRYDIESDTTSVSEYWTPDFGGESGLTPDVVRDHLAKSVSLRLRSDVPVGAFLSGGLDSSSVVAAMQAAGDADLRTFAITFDEDEYAEGDDAEAAAKAFGTDHETHVITAADIRRELDDVVAAMDQPTVDGINTYFVSKAASEAGLKVALSGVGGDELFRGYSTFRMVPRIARGGRIASFIPRSIRDLISRPLERLDGSIDAPAGELAEMLRTDEPFGGAYIATRGLFTRRQRQQLLEADTQDFAPDVASSIRKTLSTGSDGDAVSHAEIRWYMHNQLLRDTDAMGMAHSLEVRVPLLDSEFVDTVAAAGDEAFAGDGEKPLLRDAMADELPERVLQKDKSGFTFPFADWLDDELTEVVDEALALERLEATSLDEDAVVGVRERFASGSVHWSRVWALVVLSLWIDEHITADLERAGEVTVPERGGR